MKETKRENWSSFILRVFAYALIFGGGLSAQCLFRLDFFNIILQAVPYLYLIFATRAW